MTSPRHIIPAIGLWTSLCVALAPSVTAAQSPAAAEGTSNAERSNDARDVPLREDDEAEESESPVLPTVTLPDEPPPEPVAAEPEEEPAILHRIGLGDHPDWENESEAAPDVAFEVPGDQRTNAPTPQPRTQLEGVDLEEGPALFSVAVAGGYARLLATQPLDFFRLEERFEARIPAFPVLRVGVGASQMIATDGYLIGGGPRIGLGAYFCGASWIQCEGVANVQPGVMGGSHLGVRFDLNASLDLRFLLARLVELSLGGGYSLLQELSLFHLTGQVGLVF